MTTKIIHIQPGDVTLPLREFRDLRDRGYISNVEFTTTFPTYTLFLTKSGRWSSSPTYRYTGDQKISPIHFTAYRDGLTELTITSDCSGYFTLHYSPPPKDNPIQTIKDRFLAEAKRKYYNKFFRWDNNHLVVDETSLQNYKPHKDDIEAINFIEKQFEISKEPAPIISMPRGADLIREIVIDSYGKTEFWIAVGQEEKEIFRTKIEPGIRSYNVIIPIGAMCYQKCELRLKEPNLIKSIKIKGMVIPGSISGYYRRIKKYRINDTFVTENGFLLC